MTTDFADISNLDLMIGEDEGLLFTDIPAMSSDGMYSSDVEDHDEVTRYRNNELQEGEQEELLLDRGHEYRMISIMRTKRAQVVTSPYDLTDGANTLSQIDEDQHLRWTAALPKFRNDEEDEDEVVRVEDHDESAANKEETKKHPANSNTAAAEMAFDDETIEIKPRLDQNRMR